MTIATVGRLTAGTISKRKSYNVFFKLKALECAEKKTKEVAAREMGVDSKMTGGHAAPHGQIQCHKTRFYFGIKAWRSKILVI